MPVGRKPGATKTGGRKKGVPNKITRDLKDIAGSYTEKAIATIVDLLDSENPSVRLGASRELLDRAHGKPRQAVDVGGDENKPIKLEVSIKRF